MLEKIKPKAPKVLGYSLVFVFLLLNLPLVHLMWASFFFENQVSLHWYRYLFTDLGFIKSLWTSVFVATVSSLIASIFGFVSALAMWNLTDSKLRWHQRVTKRLLNVTMILPEIVIAISLMSWFALLNIPLGLTALVLSHTTFCIVFSFLVFNSRLSSLDPAIELAALDLGASNLQILIKVWLPLLKPAFYSSFFICFLMSFDDFLISFFMTSAGWDTLPIKLFSEMRTGLSPKLSALATVMMIISTALILLFSFTNRKVFGETNR
jgi:spermidine/putrescine transport system permease protein